jgi:hypothetical protein
VNLSESELPLGLENPFFHRGPIHSPRYFFGRIEETRRALRMLRSGQCVSAVGPRHIGKTSFLSHMLDPDVQKGHYIGEEFLFVYTDCQSLGDPDKLQFYQRLWKETQLMFADRGIAGEQVEEPSGFCEFRDAVLSIRSQEKEYKLVFLLDEFEAVAQNPNLDQSFFSDLRSLASTVAYVTASQDSLFELAYADKSVLSSPFFMVFEQCHLGFLTPEEASGMVSELLKGVGHERLFTEEDLTFIFEIAGYHPYFLQVACYYLFERKREYVELTPEDYSIVRRQYADQVEPFFRYAWERSEGDEQESMQLVNKGKASHLSPEQRRRLERKCILYEGDFFSSAFAELAWKQVNRAQTWKTYLAGMGQIASWFKKALVALVTILFVFSAVLAGPDLPDLALGALGFENVTTMNIHSTGGEILVKVYSPKLLLVGRTAHIRMQVYNSWFGHFYGGLEELMHSLV